MSDANNGGEAASIRPRSLAARAHNGDLALAARCLVALCEQRPDLAQRAQRLAERITAQRFHIAVLGEFKRGKSTLVNALIGQELLPSGVVPLTVVATEVHFGAGRSTVVFTDGRRLPIEEDEIAAYVTERENPANVKAVARVEVGTLREFGTPGVVLVDTPGVASVNEHNTAIARELLAESDAAVLVLSADSPLSESELGMLAEFEVRSEKVFVVINKSDHLTGGEIEEVERFVVEHLRRVLSQWSGPYCTDAKSALRAGPVAPGTTDGFLAFRAALERFVADDLAFARRQAAVAELRRLTESLELAFQLEAAASAMDTDSVQSQLTRFESAVADGRRALDDDRVVLDHEVTQLTSDLGQRLAHLADSASAQSYLMQMDPGLCSECRRALIRTARAALDVLATTYCDEERRIAGEELRGALGWLVLPPIARSNGDTIP